MGKNDEFAYRFFSVLGWIEILFYILFVRTPCGIIFVALIIAITYGVKLGLELSKDLGPLSFIKKFLTVFVIAMCISNVFTVIVNMANAIENVFDKV